MLEIFKKKNIISLICFFLIVFISAFFLSISPPATVVVNNQSQNDIPVGEIYGTRKIGQTFEVKHEDLSAIEVLLGTYKRENSGPFIFHLRESLISEDDMVLYNGSMKKVQDNTFFRFSFPKIENYKGEEILFSKGKKYYFYLEAPHAEPGNTITIWSSSKDLYKDGEKIINGVRSQGDLVFRTEYELGWRSSFHILAKRLMASLDFFLSLFKNQAFHFALLLMLTVWVFVTIVKKLGIFQRKGGIYSVLGIILLIVSLWIILLLMKKIEVYNQFDNTSTTGELYGRKNVGQTFTAQYNHLMAIEVLMGTYKRKNTGEMIFHLKEQREDTIDMHHSHVDMLEVKDNQYHQFKIPEIINSRDKEYIFYLEAPNALPGNALTIWCNDKEDRYRKGAKIIDGEEKEGDLVFRTIYAVGLWEKIGLFLEEISRNKPSPLNKKPFYLGLIISFILTCSLFLTYIIRVIVETYSDKDTQYKDQ